MRITDDVIVSIQFTLTNESGQVLDRSPEAEPLEYLHGGPGVLPALADALTGKGAGDSFDVTIDPDRGFGPRDPSLIEVVPVATWTNPEKLSVGARVKGEDRTGFTRMYVITALDAETVTLDANHPLAGVTLRFTGSVVGVRPATAEERAAVAAGAG